MKKCAYEGCNQEVNQWQTYCVKHYIEVNQQQQAMPQQMPEQEQEIPEDEVVVMPKRQPQAMPVQQRQQMPQEPQKFKMQKQPQEEQQRQAFSQKQKTPEFDIPEEVDENVRLDLKKVALENAMKLIIDMGDYEGKTYETLLNEVRTLTAQFYRIMVEYNESVL